MRRTRGSLLALRREGRGKFGRAQGRRFQPMPQFQAEVPHPLRYHLPALLPPGGVTAPAIGVLLLVFICQSRLEGSAMQIHLDDIRSRERLLRQVREEEFVDDACTRDANADSSCCRLDGLPPPRGRARPRVPPALLGSRRGCALSDFLDAAGTDRGADADAPGPADDRARCTLCRGSQRRTRPDQRAPPRCHIGRRAEAGRVLVGAGAP